MLPFNMSVVSRKTVEIERRLCAFRQTLKTYRERICFLMHHSFRTAFTHGGKFHADDVFSAALLRILFPGIVIQLLLIPLILLALKKAKLLVQEPAQK